MPATRGRARHYPYYKVQLRDRISNVWRDRPRVAFDLLADACASRATIAGDGETRIVEWRDDGPHGLSDDDIVARL